MRGCFGGNIYYILLTGDWGLLAGPTPTALTAAGDTSDAIYSAGDSISLQFDSPTDMAGYSMGSVLTQAQLRQLVALLPSFVVPDWGDPFGYTEYRLGENVSATWVTDTLLRVDIHNTSGADARLTNLATNVVAEIGEMRACVR